jgi:hypothetical protein
MSGSPSRTCYSVAFNGNARLDSPLTPTLSPTGALEIECRGRGEGDTGGGCGRGVAFVTDAVGGPQEASKQWVRIRFARGRLRQTIAW